MICEHKGVSFHVETKLAQMLDLMADRVMKKHPTLDAVLQNSGAEGEGKTNASLVEAAYFQMKTGRPISLFFKTSSCLKFAQSTKEQIIILDEPSFETLSTDFQTAAFKDFLRLTSTMRVKRHILIINFAKFWKFPDFLVVDRALCMIHLYSKQGQDPGRFLYIKKKNLEPLWNAYKKSGKRLYGKLKTFGGKFPYIMDKMWDKLDIRVEDHEHTALKDYDDVKERAISTIGVKKSKRQINDDMKLLSLRKAISNIKCVSREKLAAELGINSARLREWAHIDLDDPNCLENLEKEGESATNHSIRVDNRDLYLENLGEISKKYSEDAEGRVVPMKEDKKVNGFDDDEIDFDDDDTQLNDKDTEFDLN